MSYVIDKIGSAISKILLTLFLISIAADQDMKIKMKLVYCFIILLLMLNDYCRYRYAVEKPAAFTISLVLSMITSALGAYYCGSGFIGGYFLVLLYDVVILLYDISEGLRKFTSILHIILFVVFFFSWNKLVPVHHFKLNELIKAAVSNGSNILMAFLPYFAVAAVYYQLFERLKAQRLASELKRANEKLERYAGQIEQFAVAKERNRVAQELHDSMGHSLTALIMHLDYLEKTVADGSRARELVLKSQVLARESLQNTREAVYALKEECSTKGLISSIREMAERLSFQNNLKVSINSWDNVEGLTPNLKIIIYKTVLEAVTNSIKHGRANRIDIGINLTGDELKLSIDDNGVGSENIVWGNGLRGIEQRIISLGGKMSCSSEAGKGFRLEVSFFLKESA